MIIEKFLNAHNKNRLKVIVLFIFSVYSPLFLINTFISITNLLDKNNSTQIRRNNIKNDIPKKLSAIKAGYLPYFVPNIIVEKVYEINLKDSFFPIGTLPNKNTYLENEGYGLIKFKSDRFGLRNDDKKWNNIYKKENIFIVGDSFVQGYAVEENFTISEIIEKKTNINTFNIGNGGNGPYEYSANIDLFLSPIIENSSLQNKIILLIYDNDNEKFNEKKKLLLENLNPIIKTNLNDQIYPSSNYVNNLEKLIYNTYKLDTEGLTKELIKWKNLRLENKFIQNQLSLQELRLRIKSLKGLKPKNNFDLPIKNTLISLKNVCKNLCQAYVAYVPGSNFWRPNKNSIEFKRYIRIISNNLDLPFIDGEIVIDKNNTDDYAPKGPHLSITGYSKLANLISDIIE